MSTATLQFHCANSNCNASFEAHMVEYPGGVNDYGWWIIQCDICREIFSEYVGRDVNDSRLSSGGKILVRMDRDVCSEEEVHEEVQRLKEGQRH